MLLAGRVAVVMGGGQTPGETLGNGRATALRFAREGAEVVVVDKNRASAEQTVALIAARGGKAEPVAADATDERECAAAIAHCLRRHGRVDVLHNNVGRSEGDAGVTEIDEASWRALTDLNLKSAVLACKHTLPAMRERGSGVIINVSSTSSICSRQTVAYSAAKAGINTLTRNLAIEYAPYGIRVNAILPGLMDTPMAIERRARERGVEREQVRRERDAQVPLGGRMGTAEDVAAAALFLASDEARYITGVLLPVDGGLSARVG